MTKSTPSLFDYFLLVSLAAIFGSSFLFTKVAVAQIPPSVLVALRLAIAALIFIAVMLYRGEMLPAFGKIWWPILGAAAFGNALPFFLISWGQAKVDAGLAAILMAMMPLMTIVIAHFATRDEKLNRWKIAGFCLGAFGVAYMIGLDKLTNLGDQVLRQYAIVGGALCYALSAIITKSLVHLPRCSLMSSLMILSTLLILPFGIAQGGLNVFLSGDVSPNAVVSTAVLGILPTAIGTMMVLAIINRQGASFLSQINFMVPVFGVVWGVVFLSEKLPANALIALCMILTGVAIARINSTKSLSHQRM